MGNRNNVHCFSNFFIPIKKIMSFSVLKNKDYTGLRTALRRISRLLFQMPQRQIRISISSLLSGMESFSFNTTTLHNEEYSDRVIKPRITLYGLLWQHSAVSLEHCSASSKKSKPQWMSLLTRLLLNPSYWRALHMRSAAAPSTASAGKVCMSTEAAAKNSSKTPERMPFLKNCCLFKYARDGNDNT